MSSESPLKKEPTAAEAMFFYAIVKHMKNKADIDWNAVAEEQNFKNAEVAKVNSLHAPPPQHKTWFPPSVCTHHPLTDK
jgi:hypothetical protein